MTAKIDLLALAEGRIRISSAQLFGANAKLYRDSANAIANYQFVLDSLASRDTTSHTPLDLAINSFIMRRSSISYDQNDVQQTINQFSPKHLKLNDISAHIILKSLTDDSLSLNVKRLTFREQSGLDVKRLSLKLEAGAHGAQLEGFTLQMPHTHLNIDSIHATYQPSNWQQTLAYQGSISQSHLVPRDFAPLLSQLKEFDHEFFLQALFHGQGTSLTLSKLLFDESKGLLSLAGNAHFTLPNNTTIPEWHADIERLAIGKTFLELLQQQVPSIPEVVTRLGNTSLTALIDGDANGNLHVQSNITTEAGHLSAQLLADPQKHFSGTFKTDDLLLDQITGNEKLGLLAMDTRIEGTPQKISVRGEVPKFVYNRYQYSNISVDGSYANGNIAGKLQVDDPNLRTEIEGDIKKTKRLDVKMTGYLNHIAPHALNLSNRWGNSSFSGIVDAEFTASTLNDAEGIIDIDDLVMRDSLQEQLHIDNLHLKSGYEDGQHFMKLIGDPIEAELKGQFEWETLPQTFVRLIAKRLPTLPGLPSATHATNNDFSMTLHVADSYWVEQLLGMPFQLHRPISLRANVSDSEQSMYVDGDIPSFTYNGVRYDDGHISIVAPSDTMLCRLQLTRQQKNGQHVRLNMNATAADNNLQTSLRWDNMGHSDLFSGELNAITSLYRNLDGQAEAHIRVQPSRLMMQQKQWDIEPCDILYSSQRLLVDHFLVRNDERHVAIDGLAGNQPTDTLTISLKDVDVAYVQDMLNFHPVDFGGNASGTALLTSAFNTPKAWATLNVSPFTFQDGRMGTLSVNANLNQELKQIDIRGVSADGPGANTIIDGFISPQRSDIGLDILAMGTHIDFLQSFTRAFLHDVGGHAYGAVRLAGPLGAMDLTGQLVVDGQATVTALGTTYQLKKDTVRLVPNHILLDGISLTDRYGNTGYLNGSIDHNHLSNLTFDLNVNTQRLLAYDIPQMPDQTFYGTIMAQGQVDLHGRPGETTINVNVTPLDNTVFTYNIASPDAITSQEFIVWGERTHEPAASEEEGTTATPHAVMTAPDTSSDLFLNLSINATPQAQLRLLMDAKTGDYITLRGDGALRSTYHNKGAFQLFGNYTVESGTYDITIQNIISKRFQFQEGGTIVFGGQPFDAALNLQARYTVPAVSLSDLNLGQSFSSNTIRVNCLMNITGTAEQPLVDFDLEMPNVNADEQQMIRSVLASQEETRQQVVYLLGIGRFYTAGINNAESQQQDQTQLAMQSFLSGTLSTQFSQLLSQVINTDSWNIGANISTGTEGWKNADYEGTISGRMLDNRLLFNGQFGYRDNVTQATPSFIGDFDLRYLLTPSGNLALKVYNQTNDRYFTRSSLNTQGIGLIMKKDFNGLGELLTSKKKNKGKKTYEQ